MDFKVLTAEEYHELKQDLTCIRKMFTDAVAELKQLKSDRLMTMKEVCEYTGFGEAWVLRHKDKIGYSQIGCKDLRFRKEHIDNYFNNSNHFIKAK